MNVYRRYFKVESGEMVERLTAIRELNEEAKEKYKKFLSKIGANREFYIRDERMSGIIFEKEPDRYLFKKLKYGWWPKRNTKKGKELNKQIKDIKTTPENSCLRLIGLTDSPSLFGSGKCHYSTLVMIPSTPAVILISTPWYDEDPEVLEKYTTDRKSGVHLNSNLDTILWSPTTEMEEIKEWQYGKIIDDWNTSVQEK